ncbi:MAG: serine/threonine-protein kinase [Planctomycetota bacterium]
MIGHQLGPYTIEAELGSGGMGTVYRAAGPRGAVALKVVHPHLLGSPGFFKRFLREAAVGKAVRHENVVRTIDCDQLVIEGRPHAYLVMEYVEGRSLRQLLRDLGVVPEPLTREIAMQTASGLAAIHEAGIVHRDLKPENILITEDDEIRIMDLGIAKVQETSIALTREGQFAGSVLYAAPEQLSGEAEVGAASDLYSLGVLLYELVTGENPFRRGGAANVIDAHLHHEPRRACEKNPETTRFLSEIIACLLAKNPGDRFESAQALREVIEAAEHSRWWRTVACASDRRPTRRVRVPRETRLHGRVRELEALEQAWERAHSGSGNTVWIDGEAGIGKSRLVAEFLDGIGGDAHVLHGAYPPSGGLGGLSDAILGYFGEVDLEQRLAPYLTVTPLLIPAFAALIRHDAPPEGAEAIQGDALYAVGVHLVRALAAEKPTIVTFDDIHFASKEGRDLVLALARAAPDHRVLVMCTARPGVPEEELAHYERLESFRRLDLTRLSGRETVELLEDAFKSVSLAEKLGGKIALKSDGVPLFIFEMIRGLREGRFILEQADGSYVQTRIVDEMEVPSAIKDLIEGRLHALDEFQRAVLDVGAVEGMEFQPELVARVLEEKRVRVLRALAEMERRHALVRGELGRTRFDQNQVQDVIYRALTPDLRAEYHALLAEAYADRLADEASGEAAVFLASHHLRGSRPQLSRPHLTPALAHLQESFDNDAAIALADRALGVPGLLEGGVRVDVLLRKAGRHGLHGERESERASLDEALALADDRGDTALRARVRLRLGALCTQTSDFAAAQDWSGQAHDLAVEAGDRKTEAGAAGQLGIVLLRQGRYEEARAKFDRQLALAQAIGDSEGEASATGNLGFAFSEQGRHDEARALLEKTLQLTRRIGARRAEAVTTGHLGIVALHQGRSDEARAYLEKQLALAREVGDRRGESVATGNLGVFFFDRSRYPEARLHYERHLALSRAIGDRAGEARATGNLGIVLSAQGRFERARAQFENHLALSREIGDPRGEAVATGNLGLVCQNLGQCAEARTHFERHLALARKIGSRRQEAYALSSLASLADVEGEWDDATRLYGQALGLRRDLGEEGTVADTLVALGAVELHQGHVDRALEHLDEALELARRVGQPSSVLLAVVNRARLPGGEIDAALAALEEHEESCEHGTKMSARYRLWELTADQGHLAEAHRLLSELRKHAPADCRDSMIDKVPLHRDIARAWG